ncbi:MAG: Ig-like domain-containing protein, partial [Thermoplasmata archaeon]|nr:Ig-like domain-containing protein [Thermoplasmata archaeon]
FTVKVEIPANATVGASDTATITATSQNDSNVSDASTITTFVNAVHNIDKDIWYPTIQEAVDNADPGNHLWARNGTHYEHVVIEKAITLTGEDKNTTIIDGGKIGRVVSIYSSSNSTNSSNMVTISGFTIKNSGDNGDDAGIYLDNADNCIIENNILKGNYWGIFLRWEADGNTITHNSISNNRHGVRIYDYSSGNTIEYNTITSNDDYGVYLNWNADDNTISHNTISNNRYGIFLDSSSGNTITNNNITSNNGNGIYLNWNANGNNITYNNISSNSDWGITITESSSGNLIENNSISKNYGGIRLDWNAYNNTISHCNILANSWCGVYMHDTSNNSVTQCNILSNHDYGIINNYCDYNQIHHNNIADSSTNGYEYVETNTSTNTWDDNYPSGGNYWGDYTGNDFYSGPNQDISGFDGIGDTPYDIIGGDNQDHYPFVNTVQGAGPQVENDTAPPEHSNEFPPPSGLTNDATPTISVWLYDNSWVNESTIKLYVNGYSVKTAKALKSDGYKVYFNVSYTHDSGFNDGDLITCRIVAKDIFGNLVDYTWQFTIDLTAPYVISCYPSDGAMNVSRTTPINVTFSEPMDKASAEAAFSISPFASGSFSWDGNTMTYTLNSELAPETTYNITIGTGAKDLAGNNMAAPHSWQFTTEEAQIRIYHAPVSSAELGENITIECIVETNGNSSVVNCTIYYIGVGGTDYISVSMTLVSGDAINGTWSATIPAQSSVGILKYYLEAWDNTSAIATHPETDPVTNPHEVSIVDTTPPLHSNEYPPDGSNISYTKVTISIEITDMSAINTNSIILYVNGFSVDYVLTVIPGGYNVSYYHEAGFSVGETVQCRIIAEDVHGNGLDYSWAFKVVVDTDAPWIVSVDPPNGTSGVPVDTNITVTFSEPMNKTSAEQGFNISPSVAGSFYWSNDTTMTFSQSSQLTINTIYTVTIDTTAKDLAGNHMESNYTWSFNTNDITPPDHLNENPAIDGYTSDLTPTISVHVTDTAGVNSSTVKLYVNGFSVAYDLTVITDGYNVSYWHEGGFSEGDVVTCRILAEDIFGNTLDFTWQFTVLDSFNISLHAGWNLISLPLIQTNTSVLSVLSSIDGQWDVVKYYDAITKTWKSYRVGAMTNTLFDLDRTMGFWLHATGNTTLIVYGQAPTDTNITLKAGWNLVGYPSMNGTRTIADALFGTGYERVEGYDSASPYIKVLNDSYIMQPGEGYWVYVPADTMWTVSCSLPLSDDTINAVGDSSETKGTGSAFTPETEHYAFPLPSDNIGTITPDGYEIPDARASSGGLSLFALAMLLAVVVLAIRRHEKSP